MKFNRVFWAVFRVSYCVDVIFWVAVLAVRTFPPADGNCAKAFGVGLLFNTLMVIIAWALLPWPKPEAAAPARKPSPSSSPKCDLEDICGQQTLEDFLDRRRAQNL